MFFALAVISMLGYAVQNTLLVRYARRMDGFSLSFYRNISFTVTLLPVLLFTTRESVVAILQQWPWLLLAGAGGAVALALRFASYNFIAVGVSQSVVRSLATILLTILGWIVLKEHLSGTVLGCMALLLFGVVWLGLQKNAMPHLNNRTLEGIGLAALAALPLAGTIFTHVQLSKTIDPYASSYFWEVSIGLMSALLVLLRWMWTGKAIQRVSLREFLAIALAASPTLLGTGGLALAVREGPVGLVSAIGASSLVVSSLLAWWLYQEKLRTQQWLAIGLIVVGLALIRLLQ